MYHKFIRINKWASLKVYIIESFENSVPSNSVSHAALDFQLTLRAEKNMWTRRE